MSEKDENLYKQLVNKLLNNKIIAVLGILIAVFYIISEVLNKSVENKKNINELSSQNIDLEKLQCRFENDLYIITKILILPLKKVSGEDRNYSEVLKSNLEKIGLSDDLVIETCYDESFKYPAVFDEKTRQRILEKNNADILVWGNYSGGFDDIASINFTSKPELGLRNLNTELIKTNLQKFSKGALQEELEFTAYLLTLYITSDISYNYCARGEKIPLGKDINVGIDCDNAQKNAEKSVKKILKISRYKKYFNSEFYRLASQVFAWQHNDKKAFEFLNKSLELDPNNYKSLSFRGIERILAHKISYKNEKFKNLQDLSIQDCEKAYAINPNDEINIYRLAIHYHLSKQNEKARQIIDSKPILEDFFYKEMIMYFRKNIEND